MVWVYTRVKVPCSARSAHSSFRQSQPVHHISKWETPWRSSFPIRLWGPYTARGPFVQTPRKLTLPQKQHSLVGNVIVTRWGEKVCHCGAPKTPPLHFNQTQALKIAKMKLTRIFGYGYITAFFISCIMMHWNFGNTNKCTIPQSVYYITHLLHVSAL
jgi:hypothetical protein